MNKKKGQCQQEAKQGNGQKWKGSFSIVNSTEDNWQTWHTVKVASPFFKLLVPGWSEKRPIIKTIKSQTLTFPPAWIRAWAKDVS